MLRSHDRLLHLRELGWGAAAIGLLLSTIGLVNTVLSLLFGALGDRMGPRRLLLIHQAVVALTLLPVLFNSGRLLITVAAFVGNLGRGQNGAAGPFSAVETALVIEVGRHHKTGMMIPHP